MTSKFAYILLILVTILLDSYQTTNADATGANWRLMNFCLHYGSNSSIYGPWNVAISGTLNISTDISQYEGRDAYIIHDAQGVRRSKNGMGIAEVRTFRLAPVNTELSDNQLFATEPYLSVKGVSLSLNESITLGNGYLSQSVSLYFATNLVELHGANITFYSFQFRNVSSGSDALTCPLVFQNTNFFKFRRWSFCHVQVGYYQSSTPSYSTMIGEIQTSAKLYRTSPFIRNLALPDPAYLMIGVNGVRTYYANLQETPESAILGLGCTEDGLNGDCLLYKNSLHVTSTSEAFANQGIAFNFPAPFMSSYGQLYNTLYLYHNSTTNVTKEYPSGDFRIFYGVLNIAPAQPRISSESLCRYPLLQGMPNNGTGNGIEDGSDNDNSAFTRSARFSTIGILILLTFSTLLLYS